MKHGITIAIDGLSSCGKSTFAKALAHELGYIYVDTGAMYRALTFAFLEAGIHNPDSLSTEELSKFLAEHKIDFLATNNESQVRCNGRLLGDAIRSTQVNALVSRVASLPAVRKALVEQQRHIGENGAIVMDGRDIGQTVFPHAELKIFMTARPEVRAQRRFDELTAKGIATTFDEVLANLQYRDHVDQTRSCDPMRKADDAIELDNSDMTPAQQMEWILPIVQAKMPK